MTADTEPERPNWYGYTPEQGQQIKAAIDRDMAKIEDAANAMRQRVTDHSEYVEGALDELRDVAANLKATIDRRTAPA